MTRRGYARIILTSCEDGASQLSPFGYSALLRWVAYFLTAGLLYRGVGVCQFRFPGVFSRDGFEDMNPPDCIKLGKIF